LRDAPLTEIIRQIRGHLELQRGTGLDRFISAPAVREAPPAGAAGPPSNSAGIPTLEALRDAIGDCTRCKLHSGRRNLVFGEGNPRARLMFVGEAPGEDEDRQGRPFVGKAGQLLTKIIQAMGYQRNEVYIANILKCRPPKNRNPEPDEIATCEPFLRQQVDIIRPEVICALGSFAAQTLLRTDRKISALRGRFHDYGGIRMMPTFHPAYLLRNPEEKRKVWEDMQKVMEVLKS
jgi:uracil-DNA glycosylase family 4